MVRTRSNAAVTRAQFVQGFVPSIVIGIAAGHVENRWTNVRATSVGYEIRSECTISR